MTDDAHPAENGLRHEHCDEGACESCDCCAAGWCINFEDGSPWADFLDRRRFITPTPGPCSLAWQLAVEEFDLWCEIALESRGFEAPSVIPPAEKCRDCGADWKPVRRGECSRCGSDNTPIPPAVSDAE